MSTRHRHFHDTTTKAGFEQARKELRKKLGLSPVGPSPLKMAAKPPKIVFKELLPGERGKLGVCPSTRLEAFKATPFPGSFKLSPKQRLHRWLCDECGLWHGQAVNPEEDNLPPDENWEESTATRKTNNEIVQTPARQPGSVNKWTQRAGSRAGKLSKEKK